MTEIIKTLTEAGPLGVVILGLGAWAWKLQQQLAAIQEQRVRDAFRIADIASACASALDRNTEALRGMIED